MSEKLHSFFAGTISLKEASGGLWRVSGYAIHPMKTFHPKEWPTIRNYLEPYLINAAPTLAGKPFLIDHARTLSPQNCLTLGKWDTEKCGVYYEGNVTEDVAIKIKSGRIKGVSVGVDFEKPGSGLVITDEGCIPYAFGFDEVSFLENMTPGDPQASIQLWEGMIKEAEESEQDFIIYPIQSLDVFLLDGMQIMWLNQERGIQAIYGKLKEKPESLQPYAYLFAKARDWDDKKIQAWLTDNPQYAKSAQTPQPVGITQQPVIVKESVKEHKPSRNLTIAEKYRERRKRR
jgi:hypothetical protein